MRYCTHVHFVRLKITVYMWWYLSPVEKALHVEGLGIGNMWVEVRGLGTMQGDLNTVYILVYAPF